MNRTAVVQIPEEQLDQVATSFIKAASGFTSQITLTRGGHCINAKSLLGFLSLMRDGGEVTLDAEGPDAGEALGQLAGILGVCGYVANQQQNPAVLAVIKHSFTTVPGLLWIVTAVVLYFYRLNKKAYNKIVQEIQERKESA